MLNRSAEPEAYAENVAKVEIEIPDRLLQHVDDFALRDGETREGFLRLVIEEEVGRRQMALRKELEDLLDGVEFDLGGKSAAEWIRYDRDHRDDKRFGPDSRER